MRGLFSIWMGVGCVSSIDKGDNHSTIDSEMETITDSGWSFGSVSDCPLNTTTVAYEDNSHLLSAVDDHFDGMTIEGAIGIQDDVTDWIIWQIVPPADIIGIGIHSGREIRLTPSGPPTRFLIADLDSDGQDDMLIFGEFIDIVWRVASEDQRFEPLMGVQHGRGIRDLGIIDANGDGNMDIWAFVGETADAPPQKPPPPPTQHCTDNTFNLIGMASPLT